MTPRKMVVPLCLLLLLVSGAVAQKLHVNDLGYLEAPGINFFVFSNQYNGFFFDEKTSGIEMIHHGVRTVTGGAVRLSATPEQWDLIPQMAGRTVNKEKNSIEVQLQYREYKFNSKVTVTAEGDGVTIRVTLDAPLPKDLEGHAGFNMEFLPSAYFAKTYFMDGTAGVFPRYPSSSTEMRPVSEKIPQFGGYSTFDDRGKGEFILPEPLATGRSLVLAPEDPERYVKIQSRGEALRLYDGRILAQNGWFVVRSLIPSGKTGTVVEWTVVPGTIPGWKRAPVIGFSQVGYHPAQNKVAIIELDKADQPLPKATVYQVTPEGKAVEKLTADVRRWGDYLRYSYCAFDFSSVRDSGLYFIQYGDKKTETFPIGTRVYDDVWHPTLDVWFPVQMDHMLVREAYRIWHGLPFQDDALQAPPNIQHFDGYWTDSTTNTKYKPLERIPGLAVGGWFDAGDFDIETAHHSDVVQRFAETWEEFGLRRDETLIDQKTKYVDIHHPDGIPDVLQQIEHGTLQLVAQLKNVGFAVRGINFPHLYQYHHLGDGSTMTDNLPYNPKLKPYESDGVSSGTLDDRWVFTPRIPSLNYGAAGALAAASRVLKDYNPSLAQEALTYALQAWEMEQRNTSKSTQNRFNEWFSTNAECEAALQLFITTHEDRFREKYEALLWPQLKFSLVRNISLAVRGVAHLPAEYKERLRPYVQRYVDTVAALSRQNPYGVLIGSRGWAGNSELISWAIANYEVHKQYPDLLNKEVVYRGLNYVFGCHPYSNLSFVAGVGTESKKRTYGSTRADFSFIAGGVVPGVLFLKPDFLENKDDWPFLWGENEVVIDICADYIFLVNAQARLLNGN